MHSDSTETVAAVEANSRALLEHLPGVAYAAATGEPGRWRYLSPGVAGLLGIDARSLIADPGLWSSRIHPSDRVAALASRDPGPGGVGTSKVEYRFMRPDGQTWRSRRASSSRNPER